MSVKIENTADSVYIPKQNQKNVNGNFMYRPISWILEPGKYASVKKVLAVFCAVLLSTTVIGLFIVIPGIIECIRQVKNQSDSKTAQIAKTIKPENKQSDTKTAEPLPTEVLNDDQEEEVNAFLEDYKKFKETGMMSTDLAEKLDKYASALRGEQTEEQTTSVSSQKMKNQKVEDDATKLQETAKAFEEWVKKQKETGELDPEFNSLIGKMQQLKDTWETEKNIIFGLANKASEIRNNLGTEENPFETTSQELRESFQAASPLIELANDPKTMIEFFSKIDKVSDSIDKVKETRKKFATLVKEKEKTAIGLK